MGWRMLCHVCSPEYSAPSCAGCDTSSAPWYEQLLQPSTAIEPHPEHLGRKSRGEKTVLTKTSSGSYLERSWKARKYLKASITFPFTGSNGFYLLVVKRVKTEELLILSQEGKMAEEFLVVNCLQLFSVQGTVVRCKRR